MPFKYAVLWDLEDTSQPAGLAIERNGFVLVEVRNGVGIPRRYNGPFEVLNPDSTRVAYRPNDEGYFEQVLIDLSRVYAIGEQSEVADSSGMTILSLLAEKVLRPRNATFVADYPVVRWAEQVVYRDAVRCAQDEASPQLWNEPARRRVALAA